MTYHETGYIDDGGKIYIKPAKSGFVWTILVALSCIVLGVFLAPRLPEQFWAWVYPTEGQAAPSLLPTAAVVFSQPGRPDAPPPRQEEPAPVSAPLFNAPNPTPYDNRAYNATAEARQAEPTPAPEEDRWADGEFWSDEEQAAFAATDVAAAKAKTDEFINNPPTPAPELIDEMEQKCGDAALVARSPLLQLWCAPLEGD